MNCEDCDDEIGEDCGGVCQACREFRIAEEAAYEPAYRAQQEAYRKACEDAKAFELTEKGRTIRAAINAANEIERAMQPDATATPTVPSRLDPTDADIRALEGNEDDEV